MIIMTMMTMMMMMTMVTSVGTATTRAGRSAVGVSSHGVPHMLRLVVQARAFQAMGTPVGTTTVTGAAAMVESQHTIMVHIIMVLKMPCGSRRSWHGPR